MVILIGLLTVSAPCRTNVLPHQLSASLKKIVLKNTDGKKDSLSAFALHRATVFIFLSSECPISNAYMPILAVLISEFAKQNIIFCGVIADPDISSEQAKEFGSNYSFTSDILMDPEHKLVLALTANVTPEVFVILGNGTIAYHGRIDDRYVALGKGRARASTNDLRDTLIQISQGRKVAKPRTKVVGCSIPELRK